MIRVFKVSHGFDIAAPDTCVHKSPTSHRGHTLKLYKCSFHTNTGKYSISNRIVDHWNNLPQHVVSRNTVNTFKNRLDKHYLHFQGLKKVFQTFFPCRLFILRSGFTLNYVRIRYLTVDRYIASTTKLWLCVRCTI